MTRGPVTRAVLLLWALFLVRATFYCVMMPLWEGWDEYAHFAWLDHWVAHGALPRFDDAMPREIEESLRLAPLSDELRWMGAPHLVHEQWWTLPEAARAERVRRLRALRGDFEPSDSKAAFYEAQQPPLYYWIVSVPLRFLSSWRLVDRVLFVRLFSAFIASFAIPLTWLAAGPRRGLIAAALLAVAPGFAIDTFRVSNDSLAIALFALALWLLMRQGTQWWQLGIVLGLGLLVKAYLLVLLGAAGFRRKSVALAVAIGGWWYLRNLLMGNSLTGWQQHASIPALWHGVFSINWIHTIDIMAKTFTWFGGWSFLSLKSWIYAMVEVTGAAAVVVAMYRKRNELMAPAAACALLAAALLYGNLVYGASQNGAILPAWYFWPAGAALAIIVANAPRWMYMLLALMLAGIDIYGASAVMMPYHAGLVERDHANVRVFFEALARLHVPVTLAALWVAATAAICIAMWRQRLEINCVKPRQSTAVR